jgi:flavin reductase (DIM6/NTAB) family NADH-FMN oxidoreductase RutF
VAVRGQESEALVAATDYPLYVVTASSSDQASGCLAGFVTQCSIEPVRFAVCISVANRTFDVAQRCAGIALHLLGADQGDVASLFGEESGDWMDKFERVEWTVGVTGAPRLAECAAWVEGPIIATFDVGDHHAFVIEVTAGGAGAHGGRFMLSNAHELDAGHPPKSSDAGQ